LETIDFVVEGSVMGITVGLAQSFAIRGIFADLNEMTIFANVLLATQIQLVSWKIILSIVGAGAVFLINTVSALGGDFASRARASFQISGATFARVQRYARFALGWMILKDQFSRTCDFLLTIGIVALHDSLGASAVGATAIDSGTWCQINQLRIESVITGTLVVGDTLAVAIAESARWTIATGVATFHAEGGTDTAKFSAG
jgi:hypothetical protein